MRFQPLRELGQGGMGIVYEAVDRESGMHVALKLLPVASPEYLFFFKREFRTLADLRHPNLVRLFELVHEADRWFFTMELVDGVTFLEYVRGAGPEWDSSRGLSPGSLPIPPQADTIRSPDAASETAEAPPPSGEAGGELNEGRLRRALVQLVRGLQTLHAAGKVHRDIKPANVLVSREGRVVILDFGLATDRTGAGEDTDAPGLGTPVYMAPEQAARHDVGPAADWYSVGVLMFQALTGRRPFEGPQHDVLHDKQHQDAPSPGRFVRDLPQDLERLCTDLLAREPAARPDGDGILGRLEAVAEPRAVRGAPFVGREPELGVLHAALGALTGRNAQAVVVKGESGVGKTALVRRFLKDIMLSPDVLPLPGRCYENESVPYKAFDDIVDALTRRLLREPASEVARLLPRRIDLLVQAFPVLGRLAGVSPPAGDVRAGSERRAQVFGAARELFARLAERHRLVLLIDDLQWADADSVALLAELLRPPGPPVLVVSTMRDAPEGSAEGLDPLVAFEQPGLSLHRLDLENLPPAEALALARACMQSRRGVATLDAAAIAAEASGHPLFIAELALCAEAPRQDGPIQRLEALIWRRITELGEPAVHILQLLALAGVALPQDTIARSPQLVGVELSQQIALLRDANLVRTRGRRRHDVVEVFHNRVRHTLVQYLAPNRRRRLHAELAALLEGAAPSATLAMHWREAGEADRAGELAARAGHEAAGGLAFGRAAHYYRLALKVKAWDAEGARTLHTQLGEALAKAGSGLPASRAFLAAAELADPGPALDLRRRAAEELLRSGHVDEGVAAVRALGIPIARSRTRAVAALLLDRAKLAVRGLGYRERSAAELAPGVVSLIDLCWTLASSLALTDHLQGALFQSRALRLALDAGEPLRIARCLMAEQGFRAAAGDERAARRVAAITDALAERMGNPVVLGMNAVGHGMSAHLLGQFLPARAALEDGIRRLRDEAGMFWELDAAHNFLIECLFYLGDLRELGRIVESCVDDARGRGDRYAATTLRIGLSNVVFLLGDDPEGAREAVAEAMKRWSPEGFHVQHWYALIARLHIALYRGDTADALAALAESWRPLWGSQILRIQHALIVARHLRARVALAAALEAPASADRPLAVAEGEARRLERVGTAWSRATAALIAGGVAAARGQAEVAIARLGEAAEGFRALDIEIFAVAALHRQGQLLGAAGEAQVRAARSWWGSRGVVRPERFLAMLAPQGGIMGRDREA